METGLGQGHLKIRCFICKGKKDTHLKDDH